MPLSKKFFKTTNTCEVTFTLSKKAARGAERIWLVGDFNSWSSSDTPMKKSADGSFSIKLKLQRGRDYQFRYLLDGKYWENDWKADKYVSAPFSCTENSVVSLTEE
ncbi:MAG TPA: isoamylase early set domain-containing protein [Treponemataceae bacterium]|nr:isoamylase early set domain-containing protein [Treponemataceae bacterium]